MNLLNCNIPDIVNNCQFGTGFFFGVVFALVFALILWIISIKIK